MRVPHFCSAPSSWTIASRHSAFVEPTTMKATVVQRRQIEGWGCSLLLHGLLLSAILPLLSALPASIHPEPFRWNVTFVEPLQQSPMTKSASDAPPANKGLQTTAANEQRPTSAIQNPPSIPQQPKNEFNETAQTSSDAQPATAAPAPTVVAPTQPETPPPPSLTTAPMPMVQDTLPVQHEAAEQPKTMVATALVSTTPSTPIATPIEQELPSSPVSSAADVAIPPAQPRDPSPTAPASAAPTADGQPSAPRADYSWLQRAVSRRLEELKRSSRPSLENAARLKVLVKAVVSNAGELMEAEVVKSSGVRRIDQEAMTLVQRAFPMPLDEALDRPQIVMRIPITYSRD